MTKRPDSAHSTSGAAATSRCGRSVANTMRLRIALRLSKRADEMKAAGYDASCDRQGGSGQHPRQRRQGHHDRQESAERALAYVRLGRLRIQRQPRDIDVRSQGSSPASVHGEEPGQVHHLRRKGSREGTGYYGIRFASGLPGKPNNWGKLSGWVDGNNSKGIYSAPLPIFKQAESYFLLAEAALRGWTSGDVKSLYEEGIRTSMANELAYKGKYAEIAEYAKGAVEKYISGTDTQIDFVDPFDPKLNTKALNKLGVKWDNNASNEDKLARIMTQKYIALFPLSTEAWAEQRRTGYPVLFPAYVNESNGAVTTEEAHTPPDLQQQCR